MNIVRVAHYLGKLPHEVRAMPYADYCDVLSVLLGDRDIDEHEAYLRKSR